jgi:hypothetical protein
MEPDYVIEQIIRDRLAAALERHRASPHRSRPVADEDRPNRRPDRQVEDVLTTMPRTPPPAHP